MHGADSEENSAPWLKASGVDCHLSVFVQAGAKKSQFVGLHGDWLKIKISAPRIEGQANAELISFLAKSFSISKSEILILKGELSKFKIIKLKNIDYEDAVIKAQSAIAKVLSSLAKKK